MFTVSVGWLQRITQALLGSSPPAANDTSPAPTTTPGKSLKTGPTSASDPTVQAAMSEVAAPFVDGPSAQPQVVDKDGMKAAAMSTQPPNAAQQQGRENRTDWLAVNEFDPNQPSWVRGWLAQERRRVEQGRQDEPRTPPGMVMAHGRTTPAREGYDYSNARLQSADLNQMEERVRRQQGVP